MGQINMSPPQPTRGGAHLARFGLYLEHSLPMKLFRITFLELLRKTGRAGDTSVAPTDFVFERARRAEGEPAARPYRVVAL